MSIFINPILQQQTNQPFPLPAPDGPDWEFHQAYYWPEWFGVSDEDVEFSETRWISPSTFGISFDQITTMVANAFLDLGAGGSPLAWRLYRRQLFDVNVPDQVCTPDWLPWIGQTCIDVPVIGGTNLLSAEEFSLQIIYHGSPPAIAITGSLTLAILAIGLILVIVLASSGHLHIDPAVKSTIESFSPAKTAAGVTEVFVWMAVAFGIAAIVLPKIQQPSLGLNVRAGPVSANVGQGSSGSARR